MVLSYCDTNCAPLVADLFMFCYKRDFMMSLSDDRQADILMLLTLLLALHPDSWMIFKAKIIYPTELKLIKAITLILKPRFRI